MNVEWKNLNIELINKNKSIDKKYIKLVQNAYGEAKVGELCAIMGPSGSGKTTLLKALAGRIPDGSRTSGVITCNKSQRKQSDWINNVAFVDQDDCCFEDLTIRQTITYSAKFRLKNTDIKVKDKVDAILTSLDLTKVANNRIKSISGGERKRTMIGVELVSDPKIILLDEPTSGLDSSYALDIIKLFKKIAEKNNVTIIFTIHQPSYEMFLLFDRLILLFNGNTVYNNTALEFKSKAESFGFIKREFCSEPEFAIEILKFREEYKEIPENLTSINKMITETLGNQEEFKIAKEATRNMFYNGFFPNFFHVLILLERRFRLYFFGTNSLQYLLYFFIALLAFCIFNIDCIYAKWREYGVRALLSIILRIDDTNALQLRDFIFDTNELAIIKEYERIIISVLLINAQSVFSSVFNGSVSHSFLNERNCIKREISVRSFTTISYYISVLIYQIFLNILSTGLFIGIFKLYFGDFLYSHFYLFSSISYFGFLPLLLLIGTMANNTAFPSILNMIFSLSTTISPHVLALMHFYLKETAKFKYIKIFRIFAFLPFYDIRYIFSMKCIDSIDKKIFSNSKYFPSLTWSFDKLKSVLGGFFEIEEIDIKLMTYLFFGITAAIIFVSIVLLNQFLRPEMRLKLQRKST
ncbi:ABC transporter [Hamiltosporidium magnivora]|uniref:ABC transporter n=1 Tax=Hamiltosporidium magnivora TaxID=148818 RepID=A0A4Q9LJ96_9MICR|nr:ABC transporter [Hamiltosporidium magnivora]